MGQFLSIGFVTNFKIFKDELHRARITRDECDELIQEQLGYKLAFFDVAETDQSFRYSLKEGLLKGDFVSLLQQIYPLLSTNQAQYEKVLGKLAGLSDTEIIQYANGKPEECFQRDSCAQNDYIRYKNNHIEIYYGDMIILALEEKIIMESYGQIFSFAKQCMVRAFPDHQLASCLRMYITG